MLPKFGFEDLEEDERLVFAAVIRAVVRADGRVSPSEAEALGSLGKTYGPGFWSAMGRAAQLAALDLGELAKGVSRPDARNFCYRVAMELAENDQVVQTEDAVLATLRQVWFLNDLGDPF